MNLSEGLAASKPLARKLEMLLRIIGCRVLKHVFARDSEVAKKKVNRYWHPKPADPATLSLGLRQLEASAHGVRFQVDLDGLAEAMHSPFVYESPDADHLRRLRERFGFDAVIAGASDEYAAMMALATWLGQCWDHGKDEVPGGVQNIDLIEAIQQGKAGKKFWCEIAAKVGVQAFTAMGWPARLVTTSRDGYTWEHAVFEAWSNTHSKWFAVDTDFNVVYESGGAPLSAYELCHQGPALMLAGHVHVRKLGPPKPSLPYTDLLPYFSYVHIDLRSDWSTRKLPWGSPAGGDLSTWWTARPDFPALLTPKIREDNGHRFDWPMNAAWLVPESFEAATEGYRVRVGLMGYSPYFKSFQVSVNGQAWRDLEEPHHEVVLGAGEHLLSVRLKTRNGETGKVRSLGMHLP